MFEIFQWMNKWISGWNKFLHTILSFTLNECSLLISCHCLGLSIENKSDFSISWFHLSFPPLLFFYVSLSLPLICSSCCCAPPHLPIAALSAVINQLQLPFGVGITSNHHHQFLDSVVGSVLQPRQMPFDHQISTNHLLQKTLSWSYSFVSANWKEIIAPSCLMSSRQLQVCASDPNY